MVKFLRVSRAPLIAALIAVAIPALAPPALATTPAPESPAKTTPGAPAAAPTPPPVAAPAPAPASGDPISIELNKLEARDNACRAFVVLGNPGGPDLSDLKLDLILFGPDQIIQRRIAVSLAPLPKGKTMVKLFDIDGQDCGKIGSVLINEVIACASSEGPVPGCEARLTPTSRTEAKLFK